MASFIEHKVLKVSVGWFVVAARTETSVLQNQEQEGLHHL